MKRKQLLDIMYDLDQQGIYVFTSKELRLRFSAESDKTFQSALRRHVKEGIIERPCRGIYVNPRAKSKDSYILECIAKALRKGEYSYLSLESLLSEVGVISQVPMSLLTVMTTGRSQRYQTPYGDIEFTHTQKSIPTILKGTYRVKSRPLRLATTEMAVKDLRRVNRNTDLINFDEITPSTK